MTNLTQEEIRLEAARHQKGKWRKWGPYLSDRQWGTVREDYSPNGTAWDYFTHDQARSRAYRWGEDGIAGISDERQRLCFAVSLWNGEDSILKERFFGLTGNEGNHGEDVKEYYFHLDNTPTHSYMKMLYKYPQKAFPYAQLLAENQNRSRHEPEFELLDTGIFDDNRYFDVFVEYAKNSAEDILIQIQVANRGDAAKTLHLLPTLWFRNTWSWNGTNDKPQIQKVNFNNDLNILEAVHSSLGKRWLYCDGEVEFLFTENETNNAKLFDTANASPYVKDGINEYIVRGDKAAVNPDKIGTKAAAYYVLNIGAGETKTVRLRLSHKADLAAPFGTKFEEILTTRQQEADEFYQNLTPFTLSEDMRNVQRQAFAGMLWTKQFYYYDVEKWLQGDSGTIPPPKARKSGRNREWFHLNNEDILSMPDKWEYPWYAAWDLAFHCIPLAMIDPDFAKYQLDILTREWYMHPNGQIPAYEWAFSDVNPPVHAWATWRVYKIEQKMYGRADRQFLERVFQKLLLNFTWWVNRKDTEGNNVFQGGFLGLDNIGVFDRSATLPTGGHIDQSDGTSWMGMYCLNMLTIALELAQANPVYEDIATKFFEHFLYIADAMNHIGEEKSSLWHEEDGFFYDVLHSPHQQISLKVRSMVGLIPLFAVDTIEPEILNLLPNFKRRLEWFIKNRPDLRRNVACMETEGMEARRLLAIVSSNKLRQILQKMLDETEFFSDYGIRALSRFHAEHPYIFNVNGCQFRVDYEPAESSSGLFGGNSNWRGTVWFPVNFLLIESLQKFHHYLGDDFKIECPTGSGKMLTLWEVASELSQRLINIFLQNSAGKRPVYGGVEKLQTDPHWQNLILFYEYFHGDNGAGIGASHQTGWTGLVAKLIQQFAEYEAQNPESEIQQAKQAIANF
ncbi:glucosidase [Calothrix sp. FACHB-1219]|uniref:MGH1-like glycoside hydrolase domain-containing protein n=1 Tax=unclassified Calothrix TaxID=2619626 RepID=UPI001687717F|nr:MULTISPECIES: glucosidase [unclassified Calothrix]MBD2207909.1 glucosidase [Calothrix sp. FACHB-168]MBD2216159.1 glucosidase [Calothrix sp. FACHB-1219]